MGAGFSKNKDKVTDNTEIPDPGPLILPLRNLKRDLLDKLSMDEEH